MELSHAIKRHWSRSVSVHTLVKFTAYASLLIFSLSPLATQGGEYIVWTHGPDIQGVGQLVKEAPLSTNSIHQTEHARFAIQGASTATDVDTGQLYNCCGNPIGSPFDSDPMSLDVSKTIWECSGMGYMEWDGIAWNAQYFPSVNHVETGVTVSVTVFDSDQCKPGESKYREWVVGLTVFEVGVKVGPDYIWEHSLYPLLTVAETNGSGLHSTAESTVLGLGKFDQTSSGWSYASVLTPITNPPGANPLKNIHFSSALWADGTIHLQGKGFSTFGNSGVSLFTRLLGAAGSFALGLPYVAAFGVVDKLTAGLSSGATSSVAFAGESAFEYEDESKSLIPVFSNLKFFTSEWQTLASCGLGSIFNVSSDMSLRPGDSRRISAKGESRSLSEDDSIGDSAAARVVTADSPGLYHLTSIPEYRE